MALNLTCLKLCSHQNRVVVADPGIFQRGGEFHPLGWFSQGRFHYHFEFSKGVSLSKCVILPHFDKIFWRNGGVGGFQPPESPLWIQQWVGYCFLSCLKISHFYRDVTTGGEGLQNVGVCSAQGLWSGRDFYRAPPVVTWNIVFSGLIRRTAPFSFLLRHSRKCE
jgi:hypothetical protein